MNTFTADCKWADPVLNKVPQFSFLDAVVQVYCIRLSDFTGQLESLTGYLNAGEKKRAAGYLDEKDSRRFIISRGMLRYILAKYLESSPGDIEFYVESGLKPRVKTQDKDLHFNISHAGDYVVIAVGEQPLGIDLEYKDETFDYDAILEKVCNREEMEFIRNGPDSRQLFYLLWTRKEALLKATGKGIDNDMPFIPSLDGMHQRDFLPGGNWGVHSFKIADDYMCSVAFPRISGRQFTMSDLRFGIEL